ncbi:uncharacterized protein [Labrus bergylta]|uniref:uncharacterized protein isoform X2 n=1 Tax=Labrus bergylta TaxID=56723 RepID=UPI00331352B4
MSYKVLLIKSQTEIHAKCKEDVTLKCSDLDSMEFLSVAWYKIDQQSHGIIRIDKGQEKPEIYNFTRPAMFGENYGLFLSSVTPEDSGIYECDISAGLGSTNKYPKVHLTVEECATQAELTTSTNALNSTLWVSHEHEKDLPAMWSITGFMAMGLAKIILSVISISVIRAVAIRSSRQQRRQW